MSVKIFLPEELFCSKRYCDIYGESKVTDDNLLSYFIISGINASDRKAQEIRLHYQYLGQIVKDTKYQQPSASSHEIVLNVRFNASTMRIHLKRAKTAPAPDKDGYVHIFLYKEADIRKLLDYKKIKADDIDCSKISDFQLLYCLQERQRQMADSCNRKKKSFYHHIPNILITRTFSLPFEGLSRLFTLCLKCWPINIAFQRTILCEHYSEWLKFKQSNQRNYNIVFDKLIGMVAMIMLFLYIKHPEDYLIEASHFIIDKLRMLLSSLKGTPIGLKLNAQLNNFLLDFFGYHIDLWAAFLEIIQPYIRQLFIPIGLLGSMGLSFQLALLTDLISVLVIHAHCFSVYSAVLYKVELNGLQSLWKMVLGKRRNVLKNRIESYNYQNSQLYLATLFFTCLLFLFPTILIYYMVFISLRIGICLINATLKMIRRQLLEFPLELLIFWCCGSFYHTDALELEYVTQMPQQCGESVLAKPIVDVCVFRVKISATSLSRILAYKSDVLQQMQAKDDNTFKRICQRILVRRF